MGTLIKAVKFSLYYFFKLFPTNTKKIVFISQYGNSFGCNTKAVFDELYARNKNYQYVIVKNDSNTFETNKSNCTFVKFNSLRYFYAFATAGIWVMNVNLSPKMKPKKNTMLIQVWHGTPLKKIGLDIISDHLNLEKKLWEQSASYWDYLISPAPMFQDILAGAYKMPTEKILNVGLPRNDFLFDAVKVAEAKERVYTAYDLDRNKKTVLYAPTFRDGEISEFNLQLDLELLHQKLSDKYTILLRLHPNIQHALDTSVYEGFVYDLSKYNDMQDVLAASDCLITDYSSSFFDYSILNRPMIFYPYDLENYEKKARGFYFDYQSFVPGKIVFTSEALTAEIEKSGSYSEDYYREIEAFAEKINANYKEKQSASGRLVDLMIENIESR